MEKLSYALGMVIGHNLKGMGVKALHKLLTMLWAAKPAV